MAESIGLEAGKVKLKNYSPEWEGLYNAEEALIKAAIQYEIVSIAHIGSTSIPNLRAKPIIDILLVLPNDFGEEKAIQILGELGYYRGEFQKEEGIFFVKMHGELHTHYLHLRKEMHGWKKYILFRDYLRTHPEVASEYQIIKDSLRELYHSKREFYTRGKEEFILGILAKI